MKGSGFEEVDDLCFHTYGEFSPNLSSPFEVGIWDSWLRYGPQGRDLGLKAGGGGRADGGEGGGENSPYV